MNVVRALVRFLSISGVYAEELLLRAQVDKTAPCNSMTQEEMERLYLQLKELLTLATSGNYNARVVLDQEGRLLDVTPFPFRKYAQLQQHEATSFTDAVDDYFTHTVVGKGLEEKTAVVNQEVERYQRILRKQEKTLEDLTQQIERTEKVGDIIYRHLGTLHTLHQQFWGEKRMGKSWDEIVSGIERSGTRSSPSFRRVRSRTAHSHRFVGRHPDLSGSP
jgi:predicted ribosome quality control (RQC) complex YloA/Tae2 family protein